MGGFSNHAATDTAELYDPATEIWTTTASMNDARAEHTACLFANGQVLVTGGDSGDTIVNIINSAEVYDPSTDIWTSTGSMNNARHYHTASLLTNGTVLVTGGYVYRNTLNSAELYDPPTNTWTMTDSMIYVRAGHRAAVLSSGSVLIAGGAYWKTAELYV